LTALHDNDPEELAAFFEEFEEQLVAAQADVLELEANPADDHRVQSVFRTVHGIKGIAAYFGLDAISALSHRLEDVLDGVRKGRSVDRTMASVILEGVRRLAGMMTRVKDDPARTGLTPEDQDYLHSLDVFLETGKISPERGAQAVSTHESEAAASFLGSRHSTQGAAGQSPEVTPDEGGGVPQGVPPDARLGEILVATGKVAQEDVLNAIAEQAKPIGEILVSQGKVSRSEVDQALSLQDRRRREAPAEAKTVRVMQRSLDEFAAGVGQLLVQSDGLKRMMEFYRRDGNVVVPAREVFDRVRSLEELANTLDSRLTTLRRVPLQQLFRRMRLLVRDLAGRLGKEISCEISGGSTRLDKTVVDDMETALVHLVRNCADHGIESADVRKRCNKKPQGTIKLSAETEQGTIVVRVEDDGRGIDPEAVRRAAVRNGILNEAKAAGLDKDRLVGLIFEPGFSLAEKVSDVSGRGVGMDAVMDFATRCGGTVEVTSEIGLGSTFSLRIPVAQTLITKDVVVLTVGGQCYGIPTGRVLDIIDGRNLGEAVMTRGLLTWRGQVVALVQLASLLCMEDEQQGARRDIIVVNTSMGQVALAASEVINHQKLVCAPLSGPILEGLVGMDGTAVMGDGRIAFILDVDVLLRSSLKDPPNKEAVQCR